MNNNFILQPNRNNNPKTFDVLGLKKRNINTNLKMFETNKINNQKYYLSKDGKQYLTLKEMEEANRKYWRNLASKDKL